ncbi:hypothetical protein JTB14_037451 [Gonioctena quinquepunctata]|nr:hypothetical protein JTB14_037451 [Gonioctena quinquepunctata]
MVYTGEHQIVMQIIYGECRKNAKQAQTLYGERFPDRHASSKHNFTWLVQHLENENDADKDANGLIVSEEVETNISAYVGYDRTASVRELCNQCNTSREKC